MKVENKRMAIPDGYGGWRLRIFHKKGNKRLSPRYLVKCGCCENSVEIYYGNEALEINGVHASVEEWRDLLDPLLHRS